MLRRGALHVAHNGDVQLEEFRADSSRDRPRATLLVAGRSDAPRLGRTGNVPDP